MFWQTFNSCERQQFCLSGAKIEVVEEIMTCSQDQREGWLARFRSSAASDGTPKHGQSWSCGAPVATPAIYCTQHRTLNSPAGHCHPEANPAVDNSRPHFLASGASCKVRASDWLSLGHMSISSCRGCWEGRCLAFPTSVVMSGLRFPRGSRGGKVSQMGRGLLTLGSEKDARGQ